MWTKFDLHCGILVDVDTNEICCWAEIKSHRYGAKLRQKGSQNNYVNRKLKTHVVIFNGLTSKLDKKIISLRVIFFPFSAFLFFFFTFRPLFPFSSWHWGCSHES